MSDYFGRLARRVVAPDTFLQPRMPSLFSSPAAASIAEEAIETRPGTASESPPAGGAKRRAAEEARMATDERPAMTADGVSEVDEAPARNAPSDAPPIDRRERVVVAPEAIESLLEEIAADQSISAPIGQAGRPIPPAALPALAHLSHRARRPAPAASRMTEQGLTRSAPPPAGHDVQITIGRIDVRAVTPPPAPERAAAKEPRTLTLDEYLAGRSRR